MPAARLADVRMRDSQPLVLGWGLDHALQQLAIARLELVTLPKRDAGIGHAIGKGVSHPLELFEACEVRTGRCGGNLNVDLYPREGLRGELGEPALETTDLAAQLGASEALVAADSKRNRLSFEQFRHKTSRV